MILDMSDISSLTPPYGGGCSAFQISVTAAEKFLTPTDVGGDRRHVPAFEPQELVTSDVDPWRASRSWEILRQAEADCPAESASHQTAIVKRKTRRSGKSSYKHVPHREKPPHLVARRNARERRRVQAVNSAFSRLRKCVPNDNRNKRLSKVKTLHRAIEYIQTLQELLLKADAEVERGGAIREDSAQQLLLSGQNAEGGFEGIDRGRQSADLNTHSTINKENEIIPRWIALEEANWDNDAQNSCLSFYDDFSDHMQSS